ncbi:hypothetical protein sce1066 [Sorangium cellulosum So ce56]|uniref:Uncharacterized protein n=1 Tax=Sorangium cellulosum (strain So ce56) TaxID=448385 RepID=A9F009_SORC5|nr:hypothetical protein sce1066 [Sorangium cellulosum So ce56]
MSSDVLDAETTLPGAGIQRRLVEPAGEAERRAAPAAGRRRGLTLAERIAQQELDAAPESSPRALDAFDAAAEASLEHAVVTPDGGLGRREVPARHRTFAGLSWDDTPRGGAAPTGRSPSALPPADSDPVSIQDLAQMLSPGVEPPSLSFGSHALEEERASQPAPALEPAAVPRAAPRTPVPARPPARREQRTTAPVARPRTAAVPRAGGTSRPVAPPSEMPPAPLSEIPSAPLSIDEGRPSSHRSSPELRLEDVQAMAALAPPPMPPARRARSGPSAAQPADASPADLALLGSLVPSPAAGPPRAAEEQRRGRARSKAAEAQGAAEGPRDQGNDERPSHEPLALTNLSPRSTARAAGDWPGQTEPRGRAERKETSGLIDLRSMAPPPGEEGEARRNEDRADQEILSINSGLFDDAAAGRSSDSSFPSQPVEPELLAVEGHTSSGEETPVRTSITAGSVVSEKLRALSTPASRQNMALAGWVTVVFIVFGAALYLAQAHGRSSSAAATQNAPAGSGALVESPPPSSAATEPAGQTADREPSLDDEPVAEPPAASPGPAEQALAASAGPAGEPAAPSQPVQAGATPGVAPEPTAAPAASAAPAATAAPAASAAPAATTAPAATAAAAATAAPQASEKPDVPERPARAAAPSEPERTKPAGKQPPPAPLLPAKDEPARFDQSAASSVLASAAAAAAGCTGEGLTGTARVAVTFAPTGKAMSARVEGGDLVGTATAGCIAAAFRDVAVPPFEGIPVTVMKQVKIR